MSVGVAVAQPAHSADLFATTRELEVLSQFGTPYSVLDFVAADAGTERLWAVEGGPELVWPTSPANHAPPAAGWLGEDPETRIPIFASVVPDDAAESLLSHHAGDWKPIGTVASIAGQSLGSVWRSEDGSVFLPFDPDEVQVNLLSERYRDVLRSDGRDWRRFAMRAYYRVRAVLPKAVQIWLRRRYAPLQARSAFPRWPVEAGLHDLWDFLYSLLESILGEPVPRIAAWPNGASWALVLTHDVESSTGLRAMDALLEVERAQGFRSSWNFVPRRDYEVSVDRIQSLAADGFEVGVHGLHHDGRDLESLETLQARLPGMRDAAAQWSAVGFRSPSTHRSWDLMPMLGFDYDSSCPDTDPFEPQGGGCCSWLPFFNDGMVELPPTMTQDHTLFVILRHRDESAWVEKAEFLRSRGGMALLVTHPDYLTDPAFLDAYGRFLARFATDAGAWKALPREVSAWWRRRADSSLVWTGSHWRVLGPAAGEARVEYARPDRGWLDVLGLQAASAPWGVGAEAPHISMVTD